MFFVILASIVSEGVFLRPSNLATILYQASIIGVLVLGQTLVVIAGGIDLSVVAILILSSVVMGGMGSERQAMMSFGALPYIGFFPALVAGFAVFGHAWIVEWGAHYVRKDSGIRCNLGDCFANRWIDTAGNRWGANLLS